MYVNAGGIVLLKEQYNLNDNLVVTYNNHFNVAPPHFHISSSHLTAIHPFISSSYIENDQSYMSTDPGYIDSGG